MALVNHATLADCVVVRRGAWGVGDVGSAPRRVGCKAGFTVRGFSGAVARAS